MTIEFHLLDAMDEIPAPLKEAVMSELEAANERIAHLIQLDRLDIVVAPEAWVLREWGLCGYANGPGRITIALDPRSLRLHDHERSDRIFGTLAHEMHYVARLRSGVETYCQRRLKIRPKGGAKDCHLGWWAELGVRLGVGDAFRGFFGGSGQRSHAELKRSAPAGRPQGGMVCRVGVSLATRALEARCRPGPIGGAPEFSYRRCFCGRGSG